MRRALAIASTLLALAVTAYAQSIGGNSGIVVNKASTVSGGGGGGGGCTGAIDLTTSCVQPMLGGL